MNANRIVRRAGRAILRFKFVKNVVARIVEFALNELVLRQQERIFSRLQSRGRDVYLNGDVTMTSPECVVLGDNVHIGEGAFFRSEGGLYIGDNTHIARDCMIYTADHETRGERLPYDARYRDRPVFIGRNVWIGARVTIAPGSRVGDGAIIGIGTTVAGEVAPGSTVVGAKCRCVGERDADHYKLLETSERYGAVAGRAWTPNCARGSRLTDVGQKPVFILSSGRSGSEAIARSLNHDSRCSAHHEPHPQLIRISTDVAKQAMSVADAMLELRAIYDARRIQDGQVYFESDQKLFNLVPSLLQLMPEARFVHLIRDGREFVASALHRGWYSPTDLNDTLYSHELDKRWSIYRLRGDLLPDPVTRWAKMDTFERLCWYWGFVNQVIQEALDNLPLDRRALVRLNDLEAGLRRISTLAGLPDSFAEPVCSNQAQSGRPAPIESWTNEQHAQFEYWCGSTMDVFFDGWRSLTR